MTDSQLEIAHVLAISSNQRKITLEPRNSNCYILIFVPVEKFSWVDHDQNSGKENTKILLFRKMTYTKW